MFRKGPSLYAFKGLAGRLGPIGVHASMLLCMVGIAISGLGGWKGSVMVPEGGDFLMAQVRPGPAHVDMLQSRHLLQPADACWPRLHPAGGAVAGCCMLLSCCCLSTGG